MEKLKNAVKTTKSIFKKCKGAEQLAVLEFNNIPTEGLNISPAQIMFGRRCRTRMLILKEKLIPRHNLKDMETLKRNKLINRNCTMTERQKINVRYQMTKRY